MNDNKMNYTIVIEKMKGHCSIQDLGRLSAQHLGFSACGASDEYAFLSGNQYLNNERNAPALEIILGQIQLTINTDCTIILTGADCHAIVTNKDKQSKNINHWQVQQLNAGDSLVLNQPKKGLITYLVIKNGIQAQSWLGSCSQNSNEMDLGFTEHKLQQGSTLTLSNDCLDNKLTNNIDNKFKLFTPTRWQNFYSPIYTSAPLLLRFIPSSLFLSLSTQQQQDFSTKIHTISANSNRMGYRLLSDFPLIIEQIPTQLSKPVSFGTIQLPNNGQAIVLMKDRQTIGGYPVLGNVMQTDLFRLSQKRPGEKVKFSVTTIEHAQQQLNLFNHKLSN